MKTRLSKFLSMILIAALIMTGFTGFAGNTKASAAEDEIKVFVTIADDTGAQVVKQKTVEVTDVDEDGAYTVYDALYCAHEKYFKGGAADGFAAEDTQYGLSLTKLWGIENGGSYGYMVNDAYAYNLADPVADNDYVNAYCYVDVNTFSDKYTYFTKRVKSVKEGSMIKLKLCTIEWDYMAGVPNAIPYADYDEIESLRLSSQFVVKDKYSSESSSEGFYLYLWKDMANTTPGDIYMRVEFNHAGYGRTIPFLTNPINVSRL